MQEQPAAISQKDAYGFEEPTPEQGLREAKHRLAQTLQPNELVWLIAEQYDPTTPAWNLDIVRQGANGSWMRQRNRFDQHAHILYFLGESALSDTAFRTTRQTAAPFPVALWQRETV